MKLLERLAEKFTRTATMTAKKEVRKSLIDFIPGVLTFGTMLLGVWIFHSSGSSEPAYAQTQPVVTRTHITNNNFFFGEMSEAFIQKIMEEYLDE